MKWVIAVRRMTDGVSNGVRHNRIIATTEGYEDGPTNEGAYMNGPFQIDGSYGRAVVSLAKKADEMKFPFTLYVYDPLMDSKLHTYDKVYQEMLMRAWGGATKAQIEMIFKKKGIKVEWALDSKGSIYFTQ